MGYRPVAVSVTAGSVLGAVIVSVTVGTVVGRYCQCGRQNGITQVLSV